MDTESLFSTLLPFLLIAIMLSYSMENVSPSAAVSIDSSQESPRCKKMLQTSLVKANDHTSGVTQGAEQTAPFQESTSVSSNCNTFLQLIPVETQHLAAPGESSLLFPPYITATPSHAFVFQEPDPPQTI